MGKFSKPRNRFQESQTQETMPPLIPPSDTKDSEPNSEPLSPLQEEEAIEKTFREVTGRNTEPNPLVDFLLKNKTPILIGLGAGVLVLLLVIVGIFAVGSATDPYEGKILDNVSIAGINVGGLTRSQAEDVIHSATDHTFTQQEMVVQIGEQYFRLSPEATGARLDVKAAVKAAYDYGRSGSQAQREAAYNASQTRGHIIALLPYLELDTDYIRNAVNEYAAGFTSTYTGAQWHLEGQKPSLTIPEEGTAAPECQTLVITLGTPGIGLDSEKLYENILDAYSLNKFLVSYQESDPDMLPAPPDLQAIYDACYIAPVDASMDQQTYEAIPGTYGYDFDMKQAQNLVDAADYGESVRVPMRLVEPGVQEDSLLFQDILGYCETPHNQNANRNHNLMLVCQFLDGLVLNPGEEFSYNNSVGERTAARGFKGAPAYSGTKLVDSIGGGVCQGSSTLYYAALVADMEIIFRINHGFTVSYIPIGLDATVNWGGPDLTFRNSSNYPIQLKAEMADGLVKMWIMGTEERDYYVKLDSEITRYVSPPEVYEEYGPESGYTDGQILQAGTTGYIVRSYKYRYNRQTDELISKDFVALSSYMTENRIIVKLVGVPDETDPTEPETGDPSEDTTAPDPGTGDTTAPPSESTAPPTESTAPPTESTAPPTESTAPPTESTAPPTESTAPPATDPPAPPPEDPQG